MYLTHIYPLPWSPVEGRNCSAFNNQRLPTTSKFIMLQKTTQQQEDGHTPSGMNPEENTRRELRPQQQCSPLCTGALREAKKGKDVLQTNLNVCRGLAAKFCTAVTVALFGKGVCENITKLRILRQGHPGSSSQSLNPLVVGGWKRR